MTQETRKKKPAPEAAAPRTLEQLILDRTHGKYTLVSLTSLWALELRRREENRHLTQNELLDAALTDVLTGKVTEEDVNAHARDSGSAAPEAKEKK